MTWPVNFIGHGKLLELHLVTAWNVAWFLLLCYSWSNATHPDHEFALTKSEPSPSLSDMHCVVSQSEGDGTRPLCWIRIWKSLFNITWGSLTCTYRYLIVNSPHYKVCTINTTDNLQITRMSFSAFPEQFKEDGLNSPLALTGEHFSAFAYWSTTLVVKCCCNLPLLLCGNTPMWRATACVMAHLLYIALPKNILTEQFRVSPACNVILYMLSWR